LFGYDELELAIDCLKSGAVASAVTGDAIALEMTADKTAARVLKRGKQRRLLGYVYDRRVISALASRTAVYGRLSKELGAPTLICIVQLMVNA